MERVLLVLTSASKRCEEATGGAANRPLTMLDFRFTTVAIDVNQLDKTEYISI